MSLYYIIEQQKNHLSGKKLEALNLFLELGFPTKKNEEYKYTHLKEITEKEYSLNPNPNHSITKKEIENLILDKQNSDYLVILNGKFNKDLSQISDDEIFVSTISEAIQNEKLNKFFEEKFNFLANKNLSFCYLNFALQNNGICLHIPKNKIVEKPIQILYVSQNQSLNTFYNTRNLLIVAESASIEVIESYHNFDGKWVFTNSVTEIFVEKNAKADWHKLQNDTENSYLIDHTFVQQERDSLATVNTFSFGGKLVRNNLEFFQNGENTQSFMNGITVIGNSQLVDHHTAVHHQKPNCESYQNYKGIFKDTSHGVFNGKVFVDKIAQKTNAYQQNNNVLLNEGATIDTKPQLEIFADDVKCSHGCTVGQLNEDALFYLRARGISKKEAQALLLFAFANDAMENIQIPSLKEKISTLLAKKLEVELQI